MQQNTTVGVFLVRGRDDENPTKTVNFGFLATALTCLALFYPTAHWVMHDVVDLDQARVPIAHYFELVPLARHQRGRGVVQEGVLAGEL